MCQAGWRGCQPLEPAGCPWLPGGALNPGLGSRPCSLPAHSLLKVVEQRVPGQPAEQVVELHLVLPLFLAPCLAWGHGQQPHYVPGLWGSHLLGYLDPGCCSAPSPQGWGAVCIGRSIPTCCVHPSPGHLTFDLGQPSAMADPPGCCRSCATCLLCLYSCQWITAKKEKRKGLRTTKVIPRVMLSRAWPAPVWEAQSGDWGAEGFWLGGSA